MVSGIEGGTNTSASGGIAVNGLVSGLDTSSIIEQLVAIQSQNIQRLELKKADATSQITIFQNLQALALGLRTSSNNLSDSTLFGGKTVTTSNTSFIRPTVTDSAAVGSHDLTVVQLAAKNQHVSNRFASDSDSSGISGDITITVGEGADAITTKVTISSSSNTFNDIKEAINNSGAAVTASIVQVDGSTNSKRLLIDANGAGTKGSFTISFNNSSFDTTVTGEQAGTGKSLDTSTTDDSDGTTFAFKAGLANPGSAVTVKIGSATIQQELSAPAISSITASTGSGTLTGGTTYYYKVTAVDATGETIGSSIAQGTTTGKTDDTVNRHMVVNFGAVTGATGYNVYFSADPDNFSSNSLVGTTNASTFTLIHGANNGTLGAPPTTATQGYTINNDTGTVNFNKARGNDVLLTYDTSGLAFTEGQKATDAILKLGTGDASFTVTKNSNVVTDLFEGVTLNLVKADSTNPVTITISKDNVGVDTAAGSFVKSVNELLGFIQEQSFYDVDTNTAGPLLGDPNVFAIQERVSDILTSRASGIASGNIRSLAEVGITLSPDTGKYSLDSSKLSSLMTSKPDQVRDLFSSIGLPTDTDIQSLTFTDDTVSTSSNGYALDITRAATRAETIGAQDISAGIAVDETLTFSFGTNVINADLSVGDSALTAVSTINSALVGANVLDYRAVYDSSTGKITVRSDDYGSKETFEVKSSQANTRARTSGLGGVSANSSKTVNGRDVAGTIGGESATGDGQILTGNSGNTNTDGLRILVTLTEAQLTSQGSFQGTVAVSRGIASKLEEFLAFLTDQTQDGAIQSAIAEANGRIDDLTKAIESATIKSGKERTRLLNQFAKLEQSLGSLQTTSTFLSGQLKQIEANSAAFASRSSK